MSLLVKEVSNRTHVCWVLDRSGSMAGVATDVIGGFNSYMDELRKDTDTECFVTVFEFEGTNVDLKLDAVDVQKAPNKENFNVGGMTNLYDAFGQAMVHMDKIVEDGDKVIFQIFTDGMENCSREYNQGLIKNMVKAREKKDWIFTYLGANHNAWSAAQSMGFSNKDTVRTYDQSDSAHAFVVNAEMTRQVRSAATAQLASENTSYINTDYANNKD